MTGVVRTVLTVERNWLTKKPDGDQTPSSIRFCPASFFHPFLRSLVPSAFRCALHHDHSALSLLPSASSRLPNRNLPLHPASTKKAPASLVHLPPTLRLLQHPCDVRGLVPQRRCRLLGQSPGGEAGEAHWPVVCSLFGGRSQFQRVQLQVLDIVFAGTQPLGCANDSPSFLSAFVLSFLRAQRLGASTSDRTIDRSMQGWLHGGIVETTMQQCVLRPWSALRAHKSTFWQVDSSSMHNRRTDNNKQPCPAQAIVLPKSSPPASQRLTTPAAKINWRSVDAGSLTDVSQGGGNLSSVTGQPFGVTPSPSVDTSSSVLDSLGTLEKMLCATQFENSHMHDFLAGQY